MGVVEKYLAAFLCRVFHRRRSESGHPERSHRKSRRSGEGGFAGGCFPSYEIRSASCREFIFFLSYCSLLVVRSFFFFIILHC